MKYKVCTLIGAAGSYIIGALVGGWDSALMTLVICMVVDYISGLVVAAVFKKSTKSETGALESRAGFKGLWRKGMMLLVVLIGNRLDIFLGISYIQDTVVIGFIANEIISLIENAGLMGVPIPKVIINAIDVLQKKTESEDFENGR